jgi:hypothetical protein
MVRSAWRLLTAVALLAGSSAALSGQGSPTNRLWPPGLQKVSSDSPALSPEEALKTFYMPPGYRVELVASEPLIQEPVALDAIRIAERWLGELNHPIQAAVLKRLDDTDWAVRYQLAASIGVLPAGIRESAAVEVLDRYGNDPVVMDATLSGLRGSESVVLERLLAIKRH